MAADRLFYAAITTTRRKPQPPQGALRGLHMTAHCFVTVIAPLPLSNLATARSLIETMLDNPAKPDVAARLGAFYGENGVHFASLHALACSGGEKAVLVLEFSADGDADAALTHVASAIEPELTPIFALARNRGSAPLLDFLRKHRTSPGHGWFSKPGLCFAGTPGLGVKQIQDEARLARHVTAMLVAEAPGQPPIARLEAVRAALRAEPDNPWGWVFDTPPATADAIKPANLAKKIALVVGGFAKTYLTPFLLLVAALALIPAMLTDFETAFEVALWGVIAIVVTTLTVLLLTYLRLRALEKRDVPGEDQVSADAVAAMFAREGHHAHNHMVSMTTRKPGLVRAITLRLAYFAIATLNGVNTLPGRLGEIGTIHFARWVTIPGTRDLLFFSNYGGSWESYLEDFITRAHGGLTAVWSNTIGFPRARNLFEGGATDGERFKRFARHSMTHTPFWHTAYPDLTNANIREHAAIRRGLVEARSGEDAAAWLALFGAEAPAEDILDEEGVQSLLLGGLGFMPEGDCLLIDLPDERKAARAWLTALVPHLGFGDGRQEHSNALVTLALSPRGLSRLGLSDAALASFPYAFAAGMRARDRMLGDTGGNAAEHWWWGQEAPDAALLVYGRTRKAAEALAGSVAGGTTLLHRIRLEGVPRDPAARREPFGFLDGISQPVIRGTHRAQRNPDPRQIVEPGEFVLGYRDCHGNLPPVPQLSKGGSFLVIRQLEQNAKAFHAYAAKQAKRTGLDEDLIEAKMVGRWKDGSPLVRWPDKPSPYGPDPDNDFLYGIEDPKGLRCPIGAHIRRAHPRESFTPGDDRQLLIANRHRILRVGRLYQPEAKQKPGLLFMCFNGDLERQFEFVQQTWIENPQFDGLDGERDPLLSKDGHFTIPTAQGPVRLDAMQQFITMRGGGYFFAPGREMIEALTGAAA
jgi:Dyp-type peroxidase family